MTGFTFSPSPLSIQYFDILHLTVPKDTNAVSRIFRTLSPDKARDVGAELGLAYNNLWRMSDSTLHLDVADAWIVGHNNSQDVSGEPTWRALALACARQGVWGLVWQIEQGVCLSVHVCMYVCMYVCLLIHGSWVRVPPLADKH